jgi:hypothetical protein
LKSLKLFMDFCELPSILSVFCLLKSMPNLEKLKMKVMLNTTFQIFLPTLFEHRWLACYFRLTTLFYIHL